MASWAEFWTAALNIMNVMRSEGYVSATWQDGGGGGGSVTYSKSDVNAFAANAQYMTDNGLWGTNGFASSLGSAQFNYYLNGGKDPNVAYITVNKPIVVLGKIINNLWQTSHVFYPGQYTEDKNGMITITLPGDNQQIDWHGVGSASLGIIGGAAEWLAGGVGEWLSGGTATSLTAPLFADGGVRIATNGARLLGYFTGHNDMANAMPTSIGAAVGKGVDMATGSSFYDYVLGKQLVEV